MAILGADAQTFTLKLRPLTEEVVEAALRSAFEDAAKKFAKAAMRRVRRGKLEGDRIHAAAQAALQTRSVQRAVLDEVDDNLVGWVCGEDLTEMIWSTAANGQKPFAERSEDCLDPNRERS